MHGRWVTVGTGLAIHHQQEIDIEIGIGGDSSTSLVKSNLYDFCDGVDVEESINQLNHSSRFVEKCSMLSLIWPKGQNAGISRSTKHEAHPTHVLTGSLRRLVSIKLGQSRCHELSQAPIGRLPKYNLKTLYWNQATYTTYYCPYDAN